MPGSPPLSSATNADCWRYSNERVDIGMDPRPGPDIFGNGHGLRNVSPGQGTARPGSDPRARYLVRQRHAVAADLRNSRSEEPTYELQSLMRISYAVFCLNNKTSSEINK